MYYQVWWKMCNIKLNPHQTFFPSSSFDAVFVSLFEVAKHVYIQDNTTLLSFHHRFDYTSQQARFFLRFCIKNVFV